MNTGSLRRARTPGWVWAIVALFAVALLATVSVVGWLSGFEMTPVHIVIDGSEALSFDLATLTDGHKVAIVLGLLAALLVVLVVVPVALVVGLAALAIGLLFGLGVPLLVGLLLMLLALSPLLLLVAFAWWLWRRASPPSKMAA
ncbi:hypothetical protein [Piscinibacter sp. XHJ-5]|uniref:hypothetical protein n=1 Tax=Piscinibacter sp. XHJ-5 TaxID=3037797 RepID=UPI0024533F5A|nr:hypothetical protein [Piscinibacter sp. XHJ-5]